MLLWEVIFLKKTPDEQKIMFSRKYEDGKPLEGDSLDKGKEIFINYISLFPAKDIQRISLGLRQNLLYSFYYIDKSYFDEGFLGAFGCAEYNTQKPYDWPEVELVASYIYSEYFKRLQEGRLNSPDGAQEYIDWMDKQIAEYYQDFIQAKEEYYQAQQKETKNSLVNTFQDIASKADEGKGKKRRFRAKKSDVEAESIEEDSESAILKEIDVSDEVITEDEQYWLKLERYFSIMMLNSFGTPLTDVLIFKNGHQIQDESEEKCERHILESMTYSVLNSFVGKQKLNLKSMKVRKPCEEGFEFVLFHTLKISGQSYLIMMTVENYDPEKQIYIGSLKDSEEDYLLTQIAREIKSHEEWFDEEGSLVDKEYKKELESLFYRNIKKLFI